MIGILNLIFDVKSTAIKGKLRLIGCEYAAGRLIIFMQNKYNRLLEGSSINPQCQHSTIRLSRNVPYCKYMQLKSFRHSNSHVKYYYLQMKS